MRLLKISSCMAENSDLLCASIAGYISGNLDIDTEYVTGIPWQQREQLFDCGEIQILWLCGLPYVAKADASQPMTLLAVPVPAGRRYGSHAVYFSDIVVRSDSAYRNFAELRNSRWAYNEPHSHSGYNVVRAHLGGLGIRKGFFREVIQSGPIALRFRWY